MLDVFVPINLTNSQFKSEVYTKSLLAEQSTPVAFTLEDSIASASGALVQDQLSAQS